MNPTMYKLKRDEIKAECKEYLANRGSFKYSTERAAHHFLQLISDLESAEKRIAILEEALEEITKPRPDVEVPSFGDEDENDKLHAMNRVRRDIAREALAKSREVGV